jgi:hypothetical protein
MKPTIVAGVIIGLCRMEKGGAAVVRDIGKDASTPVIEICAEDAKPGDDPRWMR